LKDDTSLVAVQ